MTSLVSNAETLPGVSPTARKKLMEDMLRGVSRSFYLTLRVLPKDLRHLVGLAYLLARAADTIADTSAGTSPMAPAQRLELLLAFRDQVRGPASIQALGRIERALAQGPASPEETAQESRGWVPEEQNLLSSLPEVFALLEALPEEDGRLVRSVLATLTYGMESDLINFPGEDSGQIAALEATSDQDRYLYHVAGCVGQFWTEISMAHVSKLGRWDQNAMCELGVRFGKALQLTNILRDVPRDLRQGRSYIPMDQLEPLGLKPPDLLDVESGHRAWPVFVSGINTALAHYNAAEAYLTAIPRSCFRLRLAALWPMLIGLATLSKLAADARRGFWLYPERPSRVTRWWVYRTVALSIPAVFSNTALRAWIHRLRRGVEAKLA